MSKGVIYVMTTAVPGLIKIGKTQTKQFSKRMRHLENNGYYNVVGLRRAFAIEVDDYGDKEKLVHEVFAKHRVADSELFALDLELVEQLLLAFEGTVVFPENVNKEQRFDAVSKTRAESNYFSFYRIGLKNGDQISLCYDATITAKIVGEREVEYSGYIYKLTPLTRKIAEEIGKANKSESYRGAQYWCYNGVRLADMKNID